MIYTDYEKRDAANRKAAAVINNTITMLKRHPDLAGDIIGRAYHQGIMDGVKWETTYRKGFVCPQCDEWMQINHGTATWNDIKWCPLCGLDFTKHPVEQKDV